MHIYHRTNAKDYAKLGRDGEWHIEGGQIAMSTTPQIGSGDEFGPIVLTIDRDALLARGARLLAVQYDLDWLQANGLLVYVTGQDRDGWVDWAEAQYPNSNAMDVINNEIAECYGSEHEIVVFVDKLLSSDVADCTDRSVASERPQARPRTRA